MTLPPPVAPPPPPEQRSAHPSPPAPVASSILPGVAVMAPGYALQRREPNKAVAVGARALQWAAGAWLAGTLGLTAVGFAPRLIGWSPSVVISGSMQPSIDPGDVLLMRTNGGALAVGDIIIVPDPSHPGHRISHRIREIRDDGLIVTKGDANQSEDTFRTPVTDVIGKVVMVVPFAGQAALLWQRGAPMDYAYWVVLLLATVVLSWSPGRRAG